MQSAFEPVNTLRIQIIAIAASLVLIVTIFELIRRGKLREEYSLIWFASSLVFLFFSIWRGALDTIAHRLGIAYAPALLLLLMLFFGILLLVHFSMAISRLTSENKRLTQEIALLALRSEERQGRGAPHEE